MPAVFWLRAKSFSILVLPVGQFSAGARIIIETATNYDGTLTYIEFNSDHRTPI